MASTMPASRRPDPVHSADAQRTLPLKRLVKGPEKVQSTDGDWILKRIDAALERAFPGQKGNGALTMEMDPSYVNRLLDGDGHLSVRKLGLLGENFWRALLDEVREHFGMDDDAARLDRALDGLQASAKVIAEIARKGLSR